MEQEELTPDWLSLRHRLTFAIRRLRGGSNRLGYSRRDLWPRRADCARAPLRRIAAGAAEAIVLRGARRAKAVLRTVQLSRPRCQPRHHRPAHLAQGTRRPEADSRQPVCLGSGAVCVTALLSCPGRGAARSGALLNRGPAMRSEMGPGSAEQRFTLQRVRDAGSAASSFLFDPAQRNFLQVCSTPCNTAEWSLA